MKRLIILALFVFGLTTVSKGDHKPNTSFQSTIETKVYICYSPSAYVYHSTLKCSGIRNCRHEIYEVTLDEAINKYGSRACKLCYWYSVLLPFA